MFLKIILIQVIDFAGARISKKKNDATHSLGRITKRHKESEL